MLPCVCQHLIQRQSHLLLKSPLAPLSKIKTNVFISQGFFLPSPHFPHLSSPSNEILHHVMSCFSGELPPRLNKAVCVSRITSKIAYHNEWAAGPPSSTTDTTVVVFPSHRVTKLSIPSLHQTSLSFLRMSIATQCPLLFRNPLGLRPLTKNITVRKCSCQLFFFLISSSRW